MLVRQRKSAMLDSSYAVSKDVVGKRAPAAPAVFGAGVIRSPQLSGAGYPLESVFDNEFLFVVLVVLFAGHVTLQVVASRLGI